MRTAKKTPNTSNAKVVSLVEGVPTKRASEAGKFQVLFEKASDAICMIRAVSELGPSKIDEINQAFEDLTGYMASELKGGAFSQLCPDPEQAHIPARSRPLSAEMLKSQGTYEDVAVLKKDGYFALIDLTVRLVRSGAQPMTILLLRDVSEKKKMERELITKHAELKNAYFQLEKNNLELKTMQETLVQAGKMAALGELAAGIAHEINQPLQAIRGFAQELRDSLKVKLGETGFQGEVEDGFKEIISGADKMAKIIQYLRAFTRKSTEDFELVDLHEVIEDALKMLGRQLASRGIQVHREFSKVLPKIYANPIQLEQVFINLATNARDAIEETGRGSGNISILTRQAENFLEVVFKDDGCGMNEKTRAKVFNPFFTTKEVGKGTGLGLSISFGILNKLHSSIQISSEVGKGAEFLIRIPVDFRELA